MFLLQVIVLEDYFFKPSATQENEESEKEPVSETSVKHEQPEMLGQDNEFYSLNNAMIIYTSGTTGPPKGIM